MLFSGIYKMVLTSISMQTVGISTAVVGGVGLIIGLILGIAGKKLEVEVDEKEGMVRELLPGANCGGCGYPGCDGLAEAIAAGKAPVNACPVASEEANNQIAKVMGQEAGETNKQVAYVNCAGTCDKTEVDYKYHGVEDCNLAATVPGNASKKCKYGCMGFGSCVNVCAFDAIDIIDGIAVINKEKCTGCSNCVAECPNNLIEMVPNKAKTLVACSSYDKGRDVKAACSVGCIGCRLCVKACEDDAIHVEDNLAYIDYEKCTNCGKCAEVCPVNIIEVKPA